MLERLKNDIATRHIPVYVISTEEARERAYHAGARGFLAKPIQSKDVLDGLLDDIKMLRERAPGKACWWSSPTRTSAACIESGIGGADDVDVALCERS